MSVDPDDARAIQNFQTYLRIPSVQPDVDYTDCVTFLTGQADEIDLPWAVYNVYPDKPVLVITWEGTVPTLGSIVLNSHMDVVPVDPEFWTHDPFGAEIDAEGNIYARGSQDTKGLGIQFLEAVRRLKAAGTTLLRTVHILFVPDEEDGTDGMEKFVVTDDFKKLNIAFTLDEGEANEGPEFKVYYAEKAIWHVIFNVRGTEGHGSLALPDTAGEKLRRLLDRVMDYRQGQQDKLDADPNLTVGNITFVNCTVMKGGSAPNVVPSVISATFDIRLAVDEDHDKFSGLLESWAAYAGEGIEIEYYFKEPPTPATPIDDSNPFWVALKQEFDDMEQQLIVGILAGGTDSRFLRRIGIPCIAFSPMNHTPDLAHSNDEHLNTDVFLNGIQVFLRLIPAVANVVDN